MIEVVKHSLDALWSMMFLACGHDGEDGVIGHHTDVRVI
jgi:hypothetical protein